MWRNAFLFCVVGNLEERFLGLEERGEVEEILFGGLLKVGCVGDCVLIAWMKIAEIEAFFLYICQ